MPRSANSIAKWEASRDLGAELLESVTEMCDGKSAREVSVPLPAPAEIRSRSGLSQASFARLLGVSARTLQQWEQGRRQPTGAARTVLRISAKHPEILQELTLEA
ncbi:MAG TPA: helix-turn-helix domain-containing protein [Fibrobacteria bacterium]|nr:helix-turn-helix domain-containing protein [Fibrobacteria bacterium]